MNVSTPTGVSPSAFAETGRAEVHSARAAFGASAAPASGVAEIQHVPLHALGTGSATVNATRPAFVAAPDDDTLDIIASYLSQADQLVTRDVDPSVRAVVDRSIHTLELSAREACNLLSQPNNLGKLRVLQLTDFRFNDNDLIDLANLLKHIPTTDLKVIVGPTYQVYGSPAIVEGVKPLAALRLSALTLNGIPISNDTSRALAHSVSSISISLPVSVSGEGDLYEISQIPMLRSLRANYLRNISPEAIRALQSHQALEHLQLDEISGVDLVILATSAHIRSLDISVMRFDGKAAALLALADNRVLTSLNVGVQDGNAFSVLSQNVTLQKLSMHVYQFAPASLASIATMPALQEFHLSGNARGGQSIGEEDISALCEKPLKSLSFRDIKMDGSARLLLATAKAAELRLNSCTPFESEDFAVLKQNQSIKSLSITSYGPVNNDENILSMVASGMPQLESLHITIKGGWPAETAIRETWEASGRRAATLHLARDRGFDTRKQGARDAHVQS